VLYLKGVPEHDLVGFDLFRSLLALDLALLLDLLRAGCQLPSFLALAVLVPLLYQFLSLLRPKVRLAVGPHLFLLPLVKPSTLIHLFPDELRVQQLVVLNLLLLRLIAQILLPHRAVELVAFLLSLTLQVRDLVLIASEGVRGYLVAVSLLVHCRVP
jgi:hypothetical protein